MKQVSNESAVYHLAVALEAYDKCNPDIGMGWHFSHFIYQAMKILELTTDDVNMAELL